MSRPFVPLADGAQCSIVFALGAGFVSCRLWFVRRSGVVDATTLQDLADGLFNLYSSEVMPLLSDNIALSFVQAQDWTASGGLAVITLFSSVVGGISSPSLSAMCAARVNIRSSQPPRNFRNYNFVPGIPENAVTLNTIDPTFRNDLRIAYADIIDAAAAWGTFPAWRWVCTSQELNGVPRSTQEAHRADIVLVETNVRQRRHRALVT